MSIQRPREGLGNYPVIVFGAGACFEEKIQAALKILGPSERTTVLDIDPNRVEAISGSYAAFEADATKLHLNRKRILSSLSAQPSDYVGVVTTPNHLATIISAAEMGFKRLIVEKPLVNNGDEVTELGEYLKYNQEVKVYPLDFYIQKTTPLQILTGAIKPEDFRWNWVTVDNRRPIDPSFCGSLESYIGQIEGFIVTIFEGGSFGIADLEKRPWLKNSLERGGMLSDLGTHVLGPFVAAGMMSQGNVMVDTVTRRVLEEDDKPFMSAPAKPDQPEIMTEAVLTVILDGQKIPFNLILGKTYHQGGNWMFDIRGSKGHLFMGLRTGNSLAIIPDDDDALDLIRLKLIKRDTYELAFEEAEMFFQGKPGINATRAMLDSIAIIDEMKAVSNRQWRDKS